MTLFPNWTLCLHKGGGGTHLQNAMSAWIQLWTASPYSHVELYDPVSGVCWSASGYEDRVRFKHIQFTHPEFWDFYAIPGGALPPDLRSTMNRLVGCKYDYVGAVMCGRLCAEQAQDDRKWYCFEAVSRALRWAPYRKTGKELLAAALSHGCWKVSLPKVG